MNQREAMLKDKILEYLVTVKKFDADGTIAKHIGYDPFEVGFAAEQLKEKGLVELMEITSFDSNRKDYNVSITDKGRYFFRNHSFISKYKTWKRNQSWIKAKTIAATANAVIIILIAAMSLLINYWTNIEYKRINQQLQERVNKLERQLQQQAATDSLNSIQKDSIN